MKNINKKLINLIKLYHISSTDKLKNAPYELVNQNVKILHEDNLSSFIQTKVTDNAEKELRQEFGKEESN